VTNCVAVGSLGETTANETPPGEINTRTDGNAVSELGDRVDIATFNDAGTKTDLPFNLAVFC
jgi:hypothetical protein